jgi:hypothetical protein
MDAAVSLGIWLFSQPEMFDVRWTDDRSGHDTKDQGGLMVVTAPSLVQVTSDSGTRKLVGVEEKVVTRCVVRRI